LAAKSKQDQSLNPMQTQQTIMTNALIQEKLKPANDLAIEKSLQEKQKQKTSLA